MAHTAIRKALPWAVLDTVTTGLTSILGLIILSRLLNMRDFGVVGLAQAIVGLVQLVATTGIKEAVIRQRPADVAFQDSAHWLAVMLNLASFVVCALVALVMWLHGGQALLAEVVLAQAGIGMVTGFSLLPEALLTRKMRTAALARRTMLSKAIYMVAACGLAVAGCGLWSMVLATALQAAASTTALWMAQPRLPRLRFSLTHARQLVGYGWAILAETLLWTATGRVFTLLVGAVHGVDTLGYVTFSMRAAEVVSTLLTSLYSKFGLPLFAKARRSAEETRAVFIRVTEALNVLSAPIFIGMALTARDWIPLFFGAKWTPAIPLVQVLCAAWALMFTRQLAGDLVRTAGHPRALLPAAFISAVSTCAAVFVTRGLPMVALMYGWAARIVLTLPIGVAQVRRHAGVGFFEQLRPLARPALGCLAMAAVVLSFQALYGPAVGPSRTRLAGGVLLGAAAYAAVLSVLFRAVLRHELRRLGRRASSAKRSLALPGA